MVVGGETVVAMGREDQAARRLASFLLGGQDGLFTRTGSHGRACAPDWWEALSTITLVAPNAPPMPTAIQVRIHIQ